MKFKLSNHALEEMERHGIPREMLERVLDNPQQVRTLCHHLAS